MQFATMDPKYFFATDAGSEPYSSGIDVDNFANLETLAEVERVTDCMLSTFSRSWASVDNDIAFDIFKPAIGNDVVSVSCLYYHARHPNLTKIAISTPRLASTSGPIRLPEAAIPW